MNTATLSPEYKVALIRGALSGIVLAGQAFFVTYAASGEPVAAAITAGSTFFSALAVRFGIEGAVDTRRAGTGS